MDLNQNESDDEAMRIFEKTKLNMDSSILENNIPPDDIIKKWKQI